MTDNERLTTYCPSCGQPAKVERDWTGTTVTRCDGFAPCKGPELPLDEKPAPLAGMEGY